MWVWLSIGLFGLFLLSPVKSKPYGDGDFHVEAKALVSYLSGNAPFEVVSISKAPGPVLFYSVPYLIAGDNSTDDTKLNFARAWICLLIAFMHYFIYGAIVKVNGLLTANVFMVFTFIIPLHLYYSMGIWAEPMAYLSMLLIIFGFLRKRDGRFPIIFFLGLLLLVLTRPNSILAIPCLFLISLLFNKSLRSLNLRKFQIGLILVGMSVILIGAFVKQLPNSRVTVYQDDYFSYVQHIGRFQYRNETWDWRFWDSKTRAGSQDFMDYKVSSDSLLELVNKKGVSFSDAFGKWVWQDIIDHPILTLKQFFIRVASGHILQVSSISYDKDFFGVSGKIIFWIFHVFINILNISIICFAFMLIRKYDSNEQYLLLLCIIVSILLFHGFVYMEQRYLFPIRVLYLFFASVFVGRVLDSYLNKANQN